MENELLSHLGKVAAAYSEGTNLGLGTVCRRMLGSDRFFARVKSGASFTVRVYDEAMMRFSEQWPEGHAWPDGVPRPSPASSPGEPPAASSPAGNCSADVPPPASAEPLSKDDPT